MIEGKKRRDGFKMGWSREKGEDRQMKEMEKVKVGSAGRMEGKTRRVG